MKKIFLLILIIILCCIGIITYTNSKYMSKNEYIGLLKKADNISNVKIDGKEIEKSRNRTVFDTTSVRYIKDERALFIQKDVLPLKYTWSNSETKECIVYDPEIKEYAIIDYKETDYSKWDNVEYNFIRV